MIFSEISNNLVLGVPGIWTTELLLLTPFRQSHVDEAFSQYISQIHPKCTLVAFVHWFGIDPMEPSTKIPVSVMHWIVDSG